MTNNTLVIPANAPTATGAAPHWYPRPVEGFHQRRVDVNGCRD
jgi:hypothetical protein